MQCNVFVSLLTPMWAEKIISFMVSQGLQVGPISPDGKSMYANQNSPAYLLTLKVDNLGVDKLILRNILQNYLEFNNIKYYSIIVCDGSSCWVGSNISLEKIKAEKSKAKNVPYLKLVKDTPPSESEVPTT